MNLEKAKNISIIFIAIVLFGTLLIKFESWMRPFAISLILSFLITPLYRVTSKKKLKTYLKIIGIIIIILGLLIGLGVILFQGAKTFIASNIDTQASITEMFETLSINIGNFNILLKDYINIEEVSKIASNIINKIANFSSTIVTEISTIILFLLFLLPTLNLWIKSAAKKKGTVANNYLKTFTALETSIRDYLKIKTIVSLGTGFISLIILFIFGVKYAIILAALIFLLNFIPSIGSIIAVLIVLGIQFFNTGIDGEFVLLGGLLITIQMVFGNYIEPKYMGKSLKLSPLIVILSLFFWGSIWGIGGMLFSVPFTLAIKILLEHNKDTNFAAKKLE
jgi:AI-2 transport protein TqsA